MDSERIAWMIALIAVLTAGGLAARSWLAPPAELSEAPASACDCEELNKLRRQIALLDAERAGLRREADRLRQFAAMRKDHEAQADEFEKLPPEEQEKRLRHALTRLKDLSPILHKGEVETFKELQGVFQVMMQAPMDDSGPFRALWNESEDETMRSMLVMHIVGREGEASLPFVKEELGRAKDPMLRHRLLEHLPLVARLDEDPEARELMLDTLADDSAPADTRQLAIQALSDVSTPEVRDSLLDVARSAEDEAVRERAIRALATDPATRPEMLEMAAEEKNPRLRTVAECTAKLAELEGPG